MNFKKPDRSYWENKFNAYIHDPFDKAFYILEHEERAKRIIEAFGGQAPNEEYYKNADRIASGFERGQVPSYSKDSDKNGAVDFFNNPLIKYLKFNIWFE